jgi:probable F420-dependent oxidoreductase
MTAERLKVDGGLFTDLARAPELSRELEQQGYDACWTGEIDHDPFLPLLLAAEHTERLELGTSIAVAFARNPMTVANVGWDLQGYSRGRFILGLGTQVKPHIEKRFGMPWSHPVPRMREFVLALQAIWSAWRDGGRLRFDGEFYTHTLMTPMFSPEPHEYPEPRIFIAAVGQAMTEMCGEVADGLLAHAFTTHRYLHEVTLAAVRRGLQRAGRDRSAFQVACPVFVVTGADDAELHDAAGGVRKQIAFYGSTPAYRNVLELHGWGAVADELHGLSRQGEWDAMTTLIDDEILNAFAVVATNDKLAAAIAERCDGAIDRVMPSFPHTMPADAVAAVLDELRR